MLTRTLGRQLIPLLDRPICFFAAGAAMSEMPSEVTLGPLTAIPEGEAQTSALRSAGALRFFTHIRGGFFCNSGQLPHQNGPLADGLIGNRTVICPLHAWKFDLNTGQSNEGNCKLRTYPVQVTSNGLIALTTAVQSQPAIST